MLASTTHLDLASRSIVRSGQTCVDLLDLSDGHPEFKCHCRYLTLGVDESTILQFSANSFTQHVVVLRDCHPL